MNKIDITEQLYIDAQVSAKENGLTVSQQIDHWAWVGKVMEQNPFITYEMMQAVNSEINSIYKSNSDEISQEDVLKKLMKKGIREVLQLNKEE